jgi:hypothetical protein
MFLLLFRAELKQSANFCSSHVEVGIYGRTIKMSSSFCCGGGRYSLHMLGYDFTNLKTIFISRNGWEMYNWVVVSLTTQWFHPAGNTG